MTAFADASQQPVFVRRKSNADALRRLLINAPSVLARRNAFNDALQFPDIAGALNLATDTGKAMLDAIVTQQANMIAHLNDFKLLLVLTMAAMPLVLFIGSTRQAHQAAAKKPEDEIIHAMD